MVAVGRPLRHLSTDASLGGCTFPLVEETSCEARPRGCVVRFYEKSMTTAVERKSVYLFVYLACTIGLHAEHRGAIN